MRSVFVTIENVLEPEVRTQLWQFIRRAGLRCFKRDTCVRALLADGDFDEFPYINPRPIQSNMFKVNGGAFCGFYLRLEGASKPNDWLQIIKDNKDAA